MNFYNNLLTDSKSIIDEILDKPIAIKNEEGQDEDGEIIETVTKNKQSLVTLPPFLQDFGMLPLMFVNNSSSFESKTGNSFVNRGEASLVVSFLENLYRVMKKNQKFLTIAIISPYKAQVQLFYDLLSQSSSLRDTVALSNTKKSNGSSLRNILQVGTDIFGSKTSTSVSLLGDNGSSSSNLIEVNSIDGFQGREKDIVIFSSVRSSDTQHSSIGFLNDLRRLNVAITRSKKALLLFGNSTTLSKNQIWNSLIQSIQNGPTRQRGRDAERDTDEPTFSSDISLYDYGNKRCNDYYDPRWGRYIEANVFEDQFISRRFD